MESTDKLNFAEEMYNISQNFIEHEMHVEALNTALEQIRRSAQIGFMRTWVSISDIPAIRKAPREYEDSAFNKLADSLNLKGFETASKTEGSGLLRQRVMHISWDMRGEAE